MLQNFLHRGQVDPRSLASGARGPHARPGRLGHCPARPAPSHRRGLAGDGTTARERGRGGVQADHELTLSSPEVSTWPEDGRRRRNRRRRRAGPARESATVAASPGVLARFLRQGEQGGGGGSSQLVGGGWGGAERRFYPATMVDTLGYWEVTGRVETREKEGKRRGGAVASLGSSRGSTQ
jgi:hypothetical protein